jgi:integrase
MSTIALSRIPSYRLHKPTKQAVVTLDGHDIYLGRYNSKSSRQEYDRRIGEWIAGGRRLPPASSAADLTITSLLARYFRFAERYYRKNGQPTNELDNIRYAIRPLKQLYGHTAVSEFGPLALKSLQMKMIADKLSRKLINQRIGIIKRVFRWGVSEELAPPSLSHALATVSGLRRGRTEARETLPVRPMPDLVIEAVLPHLPPVAADMVRFQRLTGCRPNEVCIVRPCDIDTSEEVWRYAPETHKCEHHGRERVIFIGPKAQEILRPYLLREKTAYCFVPAESERKRNAERRENRQSPMTPSQARRRPKSKRRRAPGDRYTASSYRRAIYRACAVAYPPPDNLPEEKHRRWRKEHQWHSNQLRHTAATEIRRQYGLEAAQVTLGHASAVVSQLYAERDLAKAAGIMRAIG